MVQTDRQTPLSPLDHNYSVVAKPHTVPVRDWRTGLGGGTEAGLGTEFLAVTRTEVDWGLSPRPQAGTED